MQEAKVNPIFPTDRDLAAAWERTLVTCPSVDKNTLFTLFNIVVNTALTQLERENHVKRII